MRVTISVGGRFHAFYLAKQLLKRGALQRLITSYPAFLVSKYGIPREYVRSVITKELLWRAWEMAPLFIRKLYNPSYHISALYDVLASRHLDACDICTAFSSFGLKTLRKARSLGALTIVDHGSAHIEYQDKILREEYALHGIKPFHFRLAHPRNIESELVEYEEADYICIPSQFSRRTFLEYGIPEKKLFVIPYGVDTSEFVQTPKLDNIFRVVFAGGMTIQKGVHYLLQAFSELKLPNSELLLVGGVSDEIKPFFKKYSGSFKYIGHVPQRELAKHYSQSSVFVLNSIHDGFGMVMIQAMACGLPVIATTNTGGSDLIEKGKNGFIIPIRDVPKLKEKLLYLFENREECNRMGASAKTRVKRGFTWDDYGEKIWKAYSKVIRQKQTV